MSGKKNLIIAIWKIMIYFMTAVAKSVACRIFVSELVSVIASVWFRQFVFLQGPELQTDEDNVL